MKSRNPILFLTIVFALVCVYQLSFTWKESNVDKEKKAYAESQFEINRTNDIIDAKELDLDRLRNTDLAKNNQQLNQQLNKISLEKDLIQTQLYPH